MKEDLRKYYVYIYLNPLKRGVFKYGSHSFEYSPFYVGRGFGDRLNKHLCESSYLNNSGNRHKNNTINKIFKAGETPIIIKLKNKLTYSESVEYEKYIISIIGRKDINTGILTNMTDGGEGTINRTLGKKTLDKMRIIKEVIQYDNLGNIIKIWESAGEASKSLGIRSQEIHKKCRNNKMLRYGGYFWKYRIKEELIDKIEIPKENLPILQYDLNGKYINTHEDSKECSKLGFHSGHVLKVCKGNEEAKSGYKYMNYMWFFQYCDVIETTIQPYKRNPKNIANEKRKIKKIDKEKNTVLDIGFIYEYRENGYRTKTILMCCNGKLKSTQGYKWEFE